MRIAVLAMLMATPATAVLAAPRCPWFTEGSAATLLGGAVNVLANTNEDNTVGSCHFSRPQGGATLQFDIYVAQSVAPPCAPVSELLTGIGTGARECSAVRSSSDVADQIDAQVRDVHFTAILSTRGTRLSTAQRQQQRDALRRAAEQVAGNLF